MQLKIKFFYYKDTDISSIIKFVRTRHSVFQPVRLECIASMSSLESAMERAIRRSENGSRIRDVGILILMFLCGCDQIQDAIRKCGISVGDRSFALIYEDDRDMEAFIVQFPEVSEIKASIPADHSDDMIFERMSYVDSMLD